MKALGRIGRIRAFASTHAARYLRSALQRRSPELQCLRSPVWTVTQLMSQYRLSFALSARLPRRAREQTPGAARNWRHEIERVLVGVPQPQVTHHLQVAQTLVRRFNSALDLVRRHERVVTTSAVRRETETEVIRRTQAHLLPTSRTLAEPALPPLPFARRAPAVENPNAPAPSNASTAAAPNQRTAARAMAAPIAEYEIERLADRVIGSLDRRLVAQRERLGSN